MKFTKIIALFMVLTMTLAFFVACDSSTPAETTAPPSGEGATTAAPFNYKLTIIVLDEDGKEEKVVNKVSAKYNGEKATTALTLIDIIEDYGYFTDEELACETTLAGDRATIVSIGGYSTDRDDGTYLWKYEVNGSEISNYREFVVPADAEIEVKMTKTGA